MSDYATIYGLCRLDETVGEIGSTRLSEYTRIMPYDDVAKIDIIGNVLGERSQPEPNDPNNTYSTFGAYVDGTFKQWAGRRFTVHGYRSNYFILCELGLETIDLNPVEKQQRAYDEVEAAIYALALSCSSGFRAAPVLQIIQHGKGGSDGISLGDVGLEGISERPLKWNYENPLRLSTTSIVDVVNIFASLRSHRKSGAYTSCRRWMRSRGNRYIEDSIVDLCIALEALYLDGVSAEINFRLAQRCALHMADDRGKREQLREFVKDVYRIRSKIVHGSLGYSTIIESDRSGIMRDKTQELYELVRGALVKRLTYSPDTSDSQFCKDLDDLALGTPHQP